MPFIMLGQHPNQAGSLFQECFPGGPHDPPVRLSTSVSLLLGIDLIRNKFDAGKSGQSKLQFNLTYEAPKMYS